METKFFRIQQILLTMKKKIDSIIDGGNSSSASFTVSSSKEEKDENQRCLLERAKELDQTGICFFQQGKKLSNPIRRR